MPPVRTCVFRTIARARDAGCSERERGVPPRGSPGAAAAQFRRILWRSDRIPAGGYSTRIRAIADRNPSSIADITCLRSRAGAVDPRRGRALFARSSEARHPDPGDAPAPRHVLEQDVPDDDGDDDEAQGRPEPGGQGARRLDGVTEHVAEPGPDSRPQREAGEVIEHKAAPTDAEEPGQGRGHPREAGNEAV